MSTPATTVRMIASLAPVVAQVGRRCSTSRPGRPWETDNAKASKQDTDECLKRRSLSSRGADLIGTVARHYKASGALVAGLPPAAPSHPTRLTAYPWPPPCSSLSIRPGQNTVRQTGSADHRASSDRQVGGRSPACRCCMRGGGDVNLEGLISAVLNCSCRKPTHAAVRALGTATSMSTPA